MNALKSVTLTTPDGVSRELRDTPGARKLIADHFGRENFLQVAAEKGDWVLFEVAWFMMHGSTGEPPAGLTLEQFRWMASMESRAEVFGAVAAAVSNGEKSKNEMEALAQRLIGSTSGPSEPSASDYPIPSSGGPTPGLNSMPESSDTASKSEPPITAPES